MTGWPLQCNAWGRHFYCQACCFIQSLGYEVLVSLIGSDPVSVQSCHLLSLGVHMWWKAVYGKGGVTRLCNVGWCSTVRRHLVLTSPKQNPGCPVSCWDGHFITASRMSVYSSYLENFPSASILSAFTPPLSQSKTYLPDLFIHTSSGIFTQLLED